MSRSLRTVLAALALLLLIAGTAFGVRSVQGDLHRSPNAASHQPASPDSENENEPPSNSDTGAQLTDDHANTLVDLLKAQGIDTTADELKTLAAKYGVGGAVRLVSWAKASGKSVDELAAMFDGGEGWGKIRKDLEAADSSLHLSPGIGWILGHGHGNANANAHANAHANH
jgi:hypothetical protein